MTSERDKQHLNALVAFKLLGHRFTVRAVHPIWPTTISNRERVKPTPTSMRVIKQSQTHMNVMGTLIVVGVRISHSGFLANTPCKQRATRVCIIRKNHEYRKLKTLTGSKCECIAISLDFSSAQLWYQ